MTWPDAEVEMNAALVAQLVESQHPDLISRSIQEVSSGFDNTIWRLGADLVVRLPRREPESVNASVPPFNAGLESLTLTSDLAPDNTDTGLAVRGSPTL